VAGEQTAPAAELHDEPVPLADGLEESQDAGRAKVGVEPESQVVDQREVFLVVERRAADLHRASESPALLSPGDALLTEPYPSGVRQSANAFILV